MRVIRAAAMGMCFGVRDALAAARQIEHPVDVTIYGELVHNESVLVELDARGFRRLGETDRTGLPETPAVLVTAHGISDHRRRLFESTGKRLIDTTCPLVRLVHQAAQELAAEGRHVLVIGRRGHVEVQGLVEDLASFDVVESPDDVSVYPHERLGIVCQSTSPPHVATAVCEAVRRRNPQADVRFIDTICHPTRDRQRAVEELCHQVDAVVVVGGRNSNNTRRLMELARRQGRPAWHVQTAGDLRPEWFAGCRTVGLTAGTSTPDDVIDAVEAALRRLPVVEVPDKRRRDRPWTSRRWAAWMEPQRYAWDPMGPEF